MRVLILAFALLLQTPAAHAGRIFTFLEGTIIEKNKEVVVLSTQEGVYWINTTVSPLNWLRRLAGKNEFSFWVRVDQIQRFRPLHRVTEYPSKK
ncbi:MAG: hypothetical protein AB7H97_21175 [Pseudobdellovibrionaceae bacterium]